MSRKSHRGATPRILWQLVLACLVAAVLASCAAGRPTLRPLPRALRPLPALGETTRAAVTLTALVALERRLDAFRLGAADPDEVLRLRRALDAASSSWTSPDRALLESQARILLAEADLALLEGPGTRAPAELVAGEEALDGDAEVEALLGAHDDAELDQASSDIVTRLLGRLDEAERRVLERATAAQEAAATAARPTTWKVAWPTKKPEITSKFGMRRDPVKRKKKRMHRGVDLRGAVGDPVFAAGPGEVLLAGWGGRGAGKAVVIRHPGGIVTQYFHLSKVTTTAGAYVESGAQIGEVGSTGRSTGPHLHFMLSKAGQAVDPVPWIGRTVKGEP